MKNHSPDLDKQIQQKQVLVQNLHQTAAALLANQADLLERLPEEVAKEREKLLTPVKKELTRLESLREVADKDFTEALANIEKKKKVTEAELTAFEEDYQSLSHEKQVLQESIRTLADKELTLTSEIKVAQANLTSLQEAISTTTITLEKQSDKSTQLELDITTFTIQRDALEQEIAQTSLDNELALKEATGKLSIINMKLGESLKRLQETQRTEESTRAELATRTVALDKREEVLVNRENSLKIQENRVYNYARAMNI